jgi:hypothetical protein
MNQGEDTTPAKYYAISAFTYLVAMVTSNKALTWVNYPTQVNNASYMSAKESLCQLFTSGLS